MRLVDADALKAIRFHDLPYSQIVPTDCDTDDKVSAYKLGWNDAIDAIVESAPTVDAVEVVRCKDCIHKPTGSGVNHDITFPEQDYRCPCRCEDYWYSWMPYDDWFCANGERREDETS